MADGAAAVEAAGPMGTLPRAAQAGQHERTRRGTERISAMEDLKSVVAALRVGGVAIYPLLFLAVIAAVVIIEKGFVFAMRTRPPGPLLQAIDIDRIAWDEFEQRLGT